MNRYFSNKHIKYIIHLFEYILNLSNYFGKHIKRVD